MWIQHHVPHRQPSVLIAVHDYPPRIGGCPAHAHAIASGLHDRGYRVAVLSDRAGSEPFAVNGVRVVTSLSMLHHCDVVFTYSVSTLTERVGRTLSVIRRPPIWLHYPCAVTYAGLDMVARADRVIAFNPQDAAITKAVCGSAAKACPVTPAVPDSRRGTIADGLAFRTRVGSDYILWVGAWKPAKGVRNLAHRFARLRLDHPEWPIKLVMFGGYGQEEFPEPHPEIVTFDANVADIPAALAGCLFVAFNSPAHPVGYDANPLILLEAMMNRKTFVAQAGTPLLDEIGHAGLLVDSDEQWLAAAESLYRNPDRRAALERAGEQAWHERYNYDRMMAELTDAIDAAVRAGAGAAS